MIRIKEHSESYQTKAQRTLLLKIFSQEFSRRNLFLTGGTALSVFYAVHRTSKDLDLFLLRERNLLEYATLLRSFEKVITTISESPAFCSYIYHSGTKTDYVYDRFSSSGRKNKILIEGLELNIDTLENITTNKICAVINRGEPKDIIDLTWLFMNAFIPEKDFPQLFKKSIKREGLLEDLLYVRSVFHHIAHDPETVLKIIRRSLLKEFKPEYITKVFHSLEVCTNKIIGKSRLDYSA